MVDAGDILKLMTSLYWGLMLVLVVILLPVVYKIFPKGQRWAGVLLVVAGIPALFIVPIVQRYLETKREQDVQQARYLEAKAVFDEQCKSAGEKIYRTVEGVEGVMLLKVREDSPGKSYHESKRDPMWPDAAAWDSAGEGYIDSFLKTWANMYGTPKDRGYPYVDVLQQDGSIVRYTETEDGDLVGTPNPANPARYAITYSNNVDPALRKYWVAGTTIQIIDQQTNELLAEKTVFIFDSGGGDTYGGGSPWRRTATKICPDEPFEPHRKTNAFVAKVLISVFANPSK